LGVRLDVVIVTVIVPEPTSVLGVKVAAAPGGKPLALNSIVPTKPLLEVTAMVYVAVPPGPVSVPSHTAKRCGLWLSEVVEVETQVQVAVAIEICDDHRFEFTGSRRRIKRWALVDNRGRPERPVAIPREHHEIVGKLANIAVVESGHDIQLFGLVKIPHHDGLRGKGLEFSR
jgi:hypothetical protein